jgi:hypothetical protein
MCTIVYIIKYHGKQISAPAKLEIISTASPQHHATDGDANEANLLQGPDFAKPNPVLDPEVQKMVDAIMVLAPRHASMKSALKEYLLTDKLLHEVASEHSFSSAALVYWVRKLGLPQRPRGRRMLLKPTEDHNRVIALARLYGIAEAARREGISKQRVSQIVHRWAPELKAKRTRRTMVPLPPSKRRPARNIVVSFRLSSVEWRLLKAAHLASGAIKISGFQKARAIVLNYLIGDGDGGSGANAVTTTKPEVEIHETVNVYNVPAA